MPNKQGKQTNSTTSCPLCFTGTTPITTKPYQNCNSCAGIFLPSKHHLSPQEEKARYETHNNDVTDPNYQQFVSPIVSSVLKQHKAKQIGLDFGAGTGPVISKLLTDHGYEINQYDPYFCPDRSSLRKKYDYIVCCEVVEHFAHPHREFKLLSTLLKNAGSLYIMTQMYTEQTDFSKWGYKDDPTHIFFYHKKTFEYIKERFNFQTLKTDGRLVILSKVVDPQL